MSEDGTDGIRISGTHSSRSDLTNQSSTSEVYHQQLDLHKMTDVQRYELCMLEERRAELSQHVQEIAGSVTTRNDEIVERELLLTQVDLASHD